MHMQSGQWQRRKCFLVHPARPAECRGALAPKPGKGCTRPCPPIRRSPQAGAASIGARPCRLADWPRANSTGVWLGLPAAFRKGGFPKRAFSPGGAGGEGGVTENKTQDSAQPTGGWPSHSDAAAIRGGAGCGSSPALLWRGACGLPHWHRAGYLKGASTHAFGASRRSKLR